ncbi:MAG TPA: glycosyltransferase [Thermoanaerobaculia bacterium]
MRIAQIVLPDAPTYERKSQHIDHAALSSTHEVSLTTVDEVAAGKFDVAHVYGPQNLPSALFRRFPVPYVASGDVARTRWPFRRTVAPRFVVSPLAVEGTSETIRSLPEAVEDLYYDEAQRPERPTLTVGSYARPSTLNLVEQTVARIERFRDDITWNLYQHPPTPADLSGVDAWIDPATAESDMDGFVAEAIVTQVPVIAARTPINELRLEKGRTGFLVPPRDPNELTHAILTVLFKPEVAQRKIDAAGQTLSKFRVRQRLRVLTQMYEILIP